MTYPLKASTSPTEHAARVAATKRVPRLWNYIYVVYLYSTGEQKPLYHIKSRADLRVLFDMPGYTLCGVNYGGQANRYAIGYSVPRAPVEYAAPPEGYSLCRQCLRWLLNEEPYFEED